MEEDSTEQVKSDENLTENANRDVNIDQNGSGIVDYFDCEKCFNTVTILRDKENKDPNNLTALICKNCKSEGDRYQSPLSSNVNQSIIREDEQQTPRIIISNSTPNSEKEEAVISPLTAMASNTDSGLSTDERSHQMGKSRSESISNDSLSRNVTFTVGITHSVASSSKAPKNTANFGVVNFYHSSGVFESDLERQLNDVNLKRVDKVYAGVDVIYKADNVFKCLPLLCPAKVNYQVRSKI